MLATNFNNADRSARIADKKRQNAIYGSRPTVVKGDSLATVLLNRRKMEGGFRGIGYIPLPPEERVDVWADVQDRRKWGDPLMEGGQYRHWERSVPGMAHAFNQAMEA